MKQRSGSSSRHHGNKPTSSRYKKDPRNATGAGHSEETPFRKDNGSSYKKKTSSFKKDGDRTFRKKASSFDRDSKPFKGEEGPHYKRKYPSFPPEKEHGAASRYKKPASSGKRFESDRFPKPEEFPLNKYIAHCGICSRRKAVDFIKAGQVTVNGQLVEEPGYKVAPKDVVKLNGKKLSFQREQIYILLNKPKGFLTTTDDPEGRHTVMELVSNATGERVFPVGRLDRNTSGLLLLTNDGDLAQKLAHPRNNIQKVYHAGLDKPLTKADFDQILKGVELEDGIATVDSLAYADAQDKTQIGLEIHIGRNRIVRRIFEHLGYQVEKLDRVLYAGLTKKNLPRGKWRLLTEKEVILLKHFKS